MGQSFFVFVYLNTFEGEIILHVSFEQIFQQEMGLMVQNIFSHRPPF